MNKIIIIFFLFLAALFPSFEENLINDTDTINKEDEAAPCLVSDILYNHGQQVRKTEFPFIV